MTALLILAAWLATSVAIVGPWGFIIARTQQPRQHDDAQAAEADRAGQSHGERN